MTTFYVARFVKSVAGACLLFVSGCVYPYSHSIDAADPAEAAGGRPIAVAAATNGIVMLDEPPVTLAPELEKACPPPSRVVGLETEGTVRNWFGLVQHYKIAGRAICAPPATAQRGDGGT